ncbi:hypothetical protein JQ631_24005 [Bradyrhizobium manausense]|uniref:hypothetical protein n=1 Tax=Bradyrhizobium manausense TaxID=989370 RepID=UPI001BA612EC|nr:hypothetical protein [Bradyrhizobium manausense]MBR0792160.1 hypothetical protein [Bradyrhizobium manausense]
MKNPFRKSQMQQLEATIASFAKRLEQLTIKRAIAKNALDTATVTRQKALLSGDLEDQRALDKVQAAVDTGSSALAGIDDALAALIRQKAEAERQLAAERDHIMRAAAAGKLAEQVGAIEAALPAYLEHSRVLSNALSEIAHSHVESSQMAGYVQNTSGQIEVAANFALAELKAMPDAIRHGRLPIPGEPVALRADATTETEPTTTVFMLRSAHHRDGDGRKRFAGQWEDAVMLVATAQRALDRGIAVPLTDPRRVRLRGMRGGDFDPKAADVVDLDAGDDLVGAATGAPAIGAANFAVTDCRAEAHSIQIEVSRT